jgi:hypothetical protein
MPSFDTISEWVLENLYLVGAVTAAVLAAILLLLLIAARRRHRSTDTKDSDFFADSSTLGEMDLSTPLEAGDADGSSGFDDDTSAVTAQARSAAPLHEVDDQPDLPPIAPRPSSAMRPAETTGTAPAQSGKNHALDMVATMVEGTGELSERESRRMGLMRAEQILAAVDELEPTLSGRGNEQRRERLARVRRHAESLMAAETARAAARAAEASAQAEAQRAAEIAAATAAAETAREATGAVPPPEASPEEMVGNFRRRGTLFPRSVPVIIDSTAEVQGSTEAVTRPEAESSAGGSGAADVETPIDSATRISSETRVDIQTQRDPGLDSLLSDPDAVGTPGKVVKESALDAVIQESLTCEPGEDAESKVEVPETGLVSDLGRSQPVHSENWTGWETVDDGESWEIEGAAGSEESWLTEQGEPAGGEPDRPPVVVESDAQTLAARHAAMPRTAEMVLELGSGERIGALESMGTSELGRLFMRTKDKDLKLAIVDALDTTPNPESIAMMQRFLDDPDPDVQLRALEAAERLLGQL